MSTVGGRSRHGLPFSVELNPMAQQIGWQHRCGLVATGYPNDTFGALVEVDEIVVTQGPLIRLLGR